MRLLSRLAICGLLLTIGPLALGQQQLGGEESIEEDRGAVPSTPRMPAPLDLDESLRRRIPQPLINDLEILRQRMQAAVQRPTLGVRIQALSPQLATHLGISGGVFVEAVIGGSSASRAKMREGDVIVRLADKKVGDAVELRDAVAAHAGQKVAVRLYRSGERLELLVQLPGDDSASDATGDSREAKSPPADGDGDSVVDEDDDSEESEAFSEMIDQMLRRELEEMARSIEDEIGNERMQRMRNRIRSLLRDRDDERSPRSSDDSAREPEFDKMKAFEEELKRLTEEVERLKTRLKESDSNETDEAEAAKGTSL